MRKKIDTKAIRRSVDSWDDLVDAVTLEASTASEVTIDSELLMDLIEHSFSAGYLQAKRDLIAERKQECFELGIDPGIYLEVHDGPYPYSEK